MGSETMEVENFYESDRILHEYLLLHYGERSRILPYPFGPHDALDFHVRCVDFLIKHFTHHENCQALDLGCAVGRASFELARYCKRVLGIDYSVRFIEKANELKCCGTSEYEYQSEGIIMEKAIAKVPEDIDRNRVDFIQGDACDLPLALGGFKLVVLANLIDRLPQPELCIKFLHHLVEPGGLLLITSPLTWLAEYTSESEWLGGFMKNNKPVKTLDTLKEYLHHDFTMLECLDVPFLIREHARKFQWSVSQASIWRRM